MDRGSRADAGWLAAPISINGEAQSCCHKEEGALDMERLKTQRQESEYLQTSTHPTGVVRRTHSPGVSIAMQGSQHWLGGLSG